MNAKYYYEAYDNSSTTMTLLGGRYGALELLRGCAIPRI